MSSSITTQQSRPPIVVLRERLEARRAEIETALPDDIKPDAFIRAVLTGAGLNPEILATSWQSLWIACLRACRDGLLPDGVEGALVAYRDRANWIPMYQGLLRRFRRSGQFKWVGADIVRRGDEFDHYVDETGPHFRHRAQHRSDEITHVWAAAITKDDAFFVAVMTPAELEQRQRMSRATRDDAPWKLWPDEMRKKTVLRALVKLLPSARDLAGDELDDDEPPAGRRGPLPPAPGDGAPLIEAPRENSTPASSAEEQGSEVASADIPRSTPPAEVANPSPAADALNVAYARGQDAKSTGMTRKAVPPEYREEARQREAICWQAGFDQKAMPEFGA